MASLLAQRRFFVGFLAQVMQYGASLLLLPFLVKTLTTAEISVWYLLITIQGLAAIADFGFGGAFARGIATAFAGADTIQTEGFNGRAAGNANYRLIGDLIHAARLWYAILAAIVFLVMITGGLAYVMSVTATSHLDAREIIVTWTIMALATAQSMYFSWVNPVLIGANRVEHDLISQIIGKGGAALLGIGVLLAGGGLLALAIAQLAAFGSARIIATLFMRPIRRQIPSLTRDNARSIRLLRTIAPNASRFGLASLSGFLITRSSVFAVTSFVGLTEGGAYAISLQLISAILQVSQLPAQFAMPRLVSFQSQGAKRAVRREAIQLSTLFVALFLLGVLALTFVAPPLFKMLGRNVILLPAPLLFFLGVVMLLEGLHSVNAFVLMTGNKVPFTRAAVLSAIAVVAGTLFAGWCGWGIEGIIAVQGLVQLSYNNWRWPLMVLQDTRIVAP